jgi:tRNA(Ile)-lysidine synthase TilS/MesJ
LHGFYSAGVSKSNTSIIHVHPSLREDREKESALIKRASQKRKYKRKGKSWWFKPA